MSESKKMVLVVDDDDDVLDFLATVLDDHGFEAQTASDGEEALEKVKEATPDAITLDLVMPGKSGVRFYGELRKLPACANIPVIVITGHAGGETGRDDLKGIVKAMAISGPASYLEKPLKAGNFIKTVKSALGL